MSKSNPSNEQSTRVTEETRIPMGLPESTLGVPEVEGYVLYWFLDSPGRIPRALRAGWEFVTPEEVQLNQHGFANDPSSDGNSDLGNRVSVYGATDERGRNMNLFLMKIRQDWYTADEERKLSQVANVVDSIRGHRVGAANEVREDGVNFRYDPLNGPRSTRGGMR